MQEISWHATRPANVKLNVVALLLLLGVVSFVAVKYSHQPWTPLRITGAAISLLSLILLVVARIQLGESFSVRAEAKNLVTSGIYSRIRNPIYVFHILMLAGICLYFSLRWWLLIFLILVPIQIFRARKEEKVLAEVFGDEYQRYKACTWF